MADFSGFTCEACGNVWTLDKRTKVTMRFEQNEFCSLGTYHRDLCPNCITEPFGWIPSKRNRNATEYRPSTHTPYVPDLSELEALLDPGEGD